MAFLNANDHTTATAEVVLRVTAAVRCFTGRIPAEVSFVVTAGPLLNSPIRRTAAKNSKTNIKEGNSSCRSWHQKHTRPYSSFKEKVYFVIYSTCFVLEYVKSKGTSCLAASDRFHPVSSILVHFRPFSNS